MATGMLSLAARSFPRVRYICGQLMILQSLHSTLIFHHSRHSEEFCIDGARHKWTQKKCEVYPLPCMSKGICICTCIGYGIGIYLVLYISLYEVDPLRKP